MTHIHEWSRFWMSSKIRSHLILLRKALQDGEITWASCCSKSRFMDIELTCHILYWQSHKVAAHTCFPSCWTLYPGPSNYPWDLFKLMKKSLLFSFLPTQRRAKEGARRSRESTKRRPCPQFQEEAPPRSLAVNIWPTDGSFKIHSQVYLSKTVLITG